MIWEIKEWSELSIKEVENIFSLRSEVFIVEQDCVYQDIDGKDQKAKHVLGKKDNELVAYARIFKSGDYFKEASFGRTVVKKAYRRKSPRAPKNPNSSTITAKIKSVWLSGIKSNWL